MGRRKTLIFDIETHESNLLWSMPPEEFVRLIGFKVAGRDKVYLTTELDDLRDAITAADFIIGHNIHTFDLPAVFGVKSDVPLRLAMDRKVYDTWTHAVLVHPCPSHYVNRLGQKALGEKPEQMKRWFSLDELAHQLGVPGKSMKLSDLAKEYGPADLPAKERTRLGFGLIPVDDARYREYLQHDVLASEAVARELLKKGPLDDYAMREQELEARKAVISSNGWRVDIPAAQARVEELRVRREAIMADLVARYDFPTEGKAPWTNKEGKAAILKALADAGITEVTRPTWPRTGAGALQLGGEVLIELTKGTAAEELGQALAELKGQRSLAQLALDSVHPDGFVHPNIAMIQRSGRWSTTDPGLTVWTARGPGAVEKRYFLPDNEVEVLVSFDLSNADARIVASLSGDRKYAERFKPGADGHLINAWAAWGKDVVGTDKSDPVTAEYRQRAKVPGHGWGYKIGYKKLSTQTGMPLKEAKDFLDAMNAAFPGVVRWQAAETAFAKQHGYVLNDWGRKLWVESGREYTQAPALKGQNGTRELICDAILAMPIPVLRRVKGQIHDELVLSLSRDRWEAQRDYVLRLMTTRFKPKRGGMEIEFPVGSGPAGENWYEATHE